jgi:hypothetical protein
MIPRELGHLSGVTAGGDRDVSVARERRRVLGSFRLLSLKSPEILQEAIGAASYAWHMC